MKERLNWYCQAVSKELKKITVSDDLEFENFGKAKTSCQEFLATANQKVLLLLGNGLSGKITLCYHLIQSLSESKAEFAFIPIQCEVADFEDFAASLKRKFTKFSIEFSADEIVNLKSYPFCFIVDDYENQDNFPNLYVNGKLSEWPNSKLLISCCSSHLLHEEHYPLYFVPFYQEEPQPQSFTEIRLSPLTLAEIDSYLQCHLIKEHWASMNALLTSEPALYELLGNPFLLKQAVTLMSESLKSINVLCEKLMQAWFAEYAKKMHKSAETKEKPFDASWLSQCSAALARCLDEQKANTENALLNLLISNAHKVGFDSERSEFRCGWRASPLIVDPASHHYRVIGGTVLQKYFSGLEISAKFTEELSTSSEKISSTTKKEAIDYKSLLNDSLMNQKLYTQDTNKLALMADSILRGDTQSEAFKDQMFAFVNASKNNAEVAVLAANAITVLNCARVSFIRKDLSHVYLLGADLSGAMLDSTNFHGANLKNVTLSQAFLRQTDLTNADLTNVKFNEFPSMECKGEIEYVAYSKNGKWFAFSFSLGNEHAIEIWKGDRTEKIITLKGSNHRIYNFSFNPDETKVLSTNYKVIQVWAVESGELLATLEGHTERVSVALFDPLGKLIASGGDDNKILLWDAEDYKILSMLDGHTKGVTSMSFDSTGTRLVSGGAHKDNTVQLWDVKNRKSLAILKGHTSFISSVGFDARGTRIFSCSGDCSIRLWDARSWEPLAIFEGHTEMISSASFNSNGTRIASGGGIYGKNNTVCIWDVESGKLLAKLEGHTKKITSISFEPKGTYIVSGSWDKTLRFWNPESNQIMVGTLNGHTGGINTVSFNPKGTRIVSGSDDQTIRFWDAESGKPLTVLKGHSRQVQTVSFNSKGTSIVSRSEGKTIRLWDAKNGKPLVILNGHTEAVTSVSFDLTGKRIVSSSYDKTVRLWDAESGKLLAILEGHVDTVTNVLFDPMGKRILSIGDFQDKTVRLWDAESGKLLIILEAHMNTINSVSFHPMGKYIVFGSDGFEKNLILWNTESEKSFINLKGHSHRVTNVLFHPKGTQVVSGSWDQTVRLWDVDSGQLLSTFEGHTSFVDSIAFDPSGTRLLSVSYKTLRLWDIKASTLLYTLEGHTKQVNSASFHPTGKYIVSGSEDASLVLWKSLRADGKKWCVLWRRMQSWPLTVFGAFLRGSRISYENKTLLLQGKAKDEMPYPSYLLECSASKESALLFISFWSRGNKGIARSILNHLDQKDQKALNCVNGLLSVNLRKF